MDFDFGVDFHLVRGFFSGDFLVGDKDGIAITTRQELLDRLKLEILLMRILAKASSLTVELFV